MKKHLAKLMGAVLIMSAFTGCAPSAPAETEGNTTAVKPATLIIGSTSEPRTLNPYLFPSRQDAIVTNLVFDNFVQPDENGEIEGSLVKDYSISEDNLVYTFNLHEGVKWHDGETFDGDDVVATFEMMANPNYTGGVSRVTDIVGVDEYAAAILEGEPDPSISGIVLSDDKMSLEVTLQEPSAAFLPGLYVSILPEHKIAEFDIAKLDEEIFNAKPIGTGPYKLDNWEVGTQITVTKNPDYFKGEPSIDNIIVKFGDMVALTTQLEVGDIDLLEVDKDGYATFDGNPDFAIQTYPTSSVNYVGFRTGAGRAEDTRDYKPVYEVEIRQALAYAIDEAKLVDAAYGISGYVHDSIFPKGSLGDSQNDTQYTQDLEKAKSLIESKGYTMGDDGFYKKDGQVLEVELMYAESSTQIAEILKEQWSKVGVDATIKMLDFGALIDELTRKSDKDGNLAVNGTNYDETTLATDAAFDAYLLGFAQESDPNEYAQYFTNDDSWNFYHYHNPEVEVLFADQAKAVDQAERKAILNEISEHLSHDLPWYTYGGVNEIVVTRSDLSGYTPDARGYTMDAHEWKLGE